MDPFTAVASEINKEFEHQLNLIQAPLPLAPPPPPPPPEDMAVPVSAEVSAAAVIVDREVANNNAAAAAACPDGGKNINCLCDLCLLQLVNQIYNNEEQVLLSSLECQVRFIPNISEEEAVGEEAV